MAVTVRKPVQELIGNRRLEIIRKFRAITHPTQLHNSAHLPVSCRTGEGSKSTIWQLTKWKLHTNKCTAWIESLYFPLWI